MRPEDAIARLKKIRDTNRDVEVMHINADTVLTRFLIELGYGDVVDAWEAVPKWYA